MINNIELNLLYIETYQTKNVYPVCQINKIYGQNLSHFKLDNPLKYYITSNITITMIV